MDKTGQHWIGPSTGRTSLLARPGLWVTLFCGPAALLVTVQWEHPQAMWLATGLGAFALIALLVAAWTHGRGGGRDWLADLLRDGADNSTNGIFLTALDGHIFYRNSAFGRWLRFADFGGSGLVYSLDEIVAQMPKGEPADEMQNLIAIVREGGAGSVEFALAAGAEKPVWCRVSVEPITARSRSGAALWRVEDITPRHELDSVRHAQEERLADLLDLLPAGFFSADGHGIILYVNQTLARWLGVSPDRLVGNAFADFVAETGSEGDLTLKDAEGRVFPALLEQSQRDGDGDDVAYTRSLVLRDFIWRDPAAGMDTAGAPAISSRFEPVSGERLRWLYDEAPVGIVLLDLDGNISDCNRAFLKLLGYHRDIVVGAPFADHISREDRGDVSAGLSKIVMGTARATHMEVRLPTSGDCELTTSLYASRMEDGSGDISGLVLHFIDATKQKNLEIQFTQSQKMQAVGQLAGGVAHDFNNLLTAMIGFCDLLLARHGPEDPSFADIQQIRQNAKRATNLVRQLLAFSRQQTLESIRLDVTEALSELSNLLGRLIGETVEIRFEHGRDLLPIRVDRGQFDQVIINLAVNARDAMPGGGSLVFRTSTAIFDTPTRRGHELMPAGCYTFIEVADTGTGIGREDMARIFEPFFSTKEVGAGTGLGLSTVYGIVHQTGGFIFVDSAPGEGTTFSIYLPECTEDQDQGDAEAVPLMAADADLTGQGTVLLVEDEDAVRLFGARALRNKGYTVLEADNGESALDVINGSDERIDLIISDVIMPGMDGYTLVNLVRHELPRVKVILMSGYAEDVFQDEIDRDPTIEFLGKPFSLNEFAGKVKEVMERL